ncbi:hypothetical protein COV61_02950, partial [Candidatus Micrarchaeota archaeon CG11_big_fil_rev_8_21_14_0_20_47_5]
MISFGREELSLEKGKTNDWVLPNGIGGYASSTAIGMNTRKYHGLLIGADENLNRTLYLSKIEETLIIDGKEFPLSLNQYPDGVVHPEGHTYLERFDFSDIAKYVYNVNEVLVEKTILIVRGENTVVVNYKVLNAGGSEVKLLLRPLINIRDFHSNTKEEQEYAARKIGNGFFIGAPKPLFVISDICQYTEEPSTIYNMVYERELQRQTGELDNHFSPGYFIANPQKGEVNIIASTAEINFARVREKLAEEAQRKKRMIDNYYEKNSIPHDQFATALLLAADSFVIKKEGKSSILAGYHWFSEWTRDILISLPGIFLST